MIDLERLVLGPAMNAFGRPATYYPDVSQPGAPAFVVRGVWTQKPADTTILDDGPFAGDELKLGVRISDFLAAPQPGDRVFVPAHRSLPDVGMCIIDDEGDDGQGGFSLVLKKLAP